MPPSIPGASPLVSLLLPNMNNEPALDLFFTALERNTTYPSVELIAVDDGSTDGSVRILRRWRDSGGFPGGFTLVEREHSGIIDTLNEALRHAQGELIVRLDGDATIETPGWLEKMMALHAVSDRVGVVTAKIILDTGELHAYGVNCVSPEGFHDGGTSITEPVGRRTLHHNVTRPLDADSPEGREVYEVDGAIGCCQLFSAALAREIGGWDVGYSPVWLEDVDFTIAARRLDRKVFYLPDVEVVHRISLRNPRSTSVPLRERALIRANRLAGRFVPQRIKDRAVAGTGLAVEAPEKIALMRRHYVYWREKWGWDMLNPDMAEVRRRYGDTEVCWASDPERRAAGEEIAATYRRGPGHPAAPAETPAR